MIWLFDIHCKGTRKQPSIQESPHLQKVFIISNSCSYIIIVNIISPPFPPHIRRNQMTIYYSCVEYIKDTCFQNKRDLFMWIIINNLIITCLYQEIYSFLKNGKSICFHEWLYLWKSERKKNPSNFTAVSTMILILLTQIYFFTFDI